MEGLPANLYVTALGLLLLSGGVWIAFRRNRSVWLFLSFSGFLLAAFTYIPHGLYGAYIPPPRTWPEWAHSTYMFYLWWGQAIGLLVAGAAFLVHALTARASN